MDYLRFHVLPVLIIYLVIVFLCSRTKEKTKINFIDLFKHGLSLLTMTCKLGIILPRVILLGILLIAETVIIFVYQYYCKNTTIVQFIIDMIANNQIYVNSLFIAVTLVSLSYIIFVRRKLARRTMIILCVVSIQLLLTSFFWSTIKCFCNNNTWLSNLFPILFAAIPGFFIWYWKHESTLKAQLYTKKDLQAKEAAINLENCLKFIDIIEEKVQKESSKIMAVNALGRYYYKGGDFPALVHQFFKDYLNDYWNEKKLRKYSKDKIDPEKTLPAHIKAIYAIIKKMIMEKTNRLSSLEGFRLCHINLSGMNLYDVLVRDTDFTNARLYNTIINNCPSQEVIFCGAILNKTSLPFPFILDNGQVLFDIEQIKDADMFKNVAVFEGVEFPNIKKGPEVVKENLIKTLHKNHILSTILRT